MQPRSANPWGRLLLAGLPALWLTVGCGDTGTEAREEKSVPHEGRYGIYALDLSTEAVSLIHSSDSPIFTSSLNLNDAGDSLVFAQAMDCAEDACSEIAVIGTDGGGFRRITSNSFRDLYPVWSPDGREIAFLSWRDADLDIFVMNSDGTAERKLFDSGSHDADIDWKGNRIVFTSGCRVWSMNADGTSAAPLTNPPRVCEWGSANLPFGDYDPRLSADGTNVVFERLVDDASPHGNYDFFRVAANGSGETRLTTTGWSQGLGSWSHSGGRIVFVVSAINGAGRYRPYVMNADGSDPHDAAPAYFPPGFLCHATIFSRDDSRLYLVGEWWQ